ncbi:MAG: hypothetical protein FGF48_04005 [Candidatus Brockarchaeota archaeon]|nr:hypothetical protein [Candidatus Brockarchaeota archaeon]
MMGTPHPRDEQNHKPSERKDWRESYYFNFVDLENMVSGFATIGLYPNLSRREFVFAVFHEGERHLYHQEHDSPFSLETLECLDDGHLCFQLVEALKSWRIVFSGLELEAEILWTGRFPAFSFGRGSGTSWEGHFEQSGKVSGVMRIRGFEKNIQGYGQRDKSWGPRQWHIDYWYAFHAQFRDFSIGLRMDSVKGVKTVSGGVSTAWGSTPVSSVRVETEYGGEPGTPTGAATRVICQDGKEYVVRSKLLSPSSFVKFTRRFPGGTTELFEAMAVHRLEESGETGSGLLEWLFTSFS